MFDAVAPFPILTVDEICGRKVALAAVRSALRLSARVWMRTSPVKVTGPLIVTVSVAPESPVMIWRFVFPCRFAAPEIVMVSMPSPPLVTVSMTTVVLLKK
jgi:hypothetical protein